MTRSKGWCCVPSSCASADAERAQAASCAFAQISGRHSAITSLIAAQYPVGYTALLGRASQENTVAMSEAVCVSTANRSARSKLPKLSAFHRARMKSCAPSLPGRPSEADSPAKDDAAGSASGVVERQASAARSILERAFLLFLIISAFSISFDRGRERHHETIVVAPLSRTWPSEGQVTSTIAARPLMTISTPKSKRAS